MSRALADTSHQHSGLSCPFSLLPPPPAFDHLQSQCSALEEAREMRERRFSNRAETQLCVRKIVKELTPDHSKSDSKGNGPCAWFQRCAGSGLLRSSTASFLSPPTLIPASGALIIYCLDYEKERTSPLTFCTQIPAPTRNFSAFQP